MDKKVWERVFAASLCFALAACSDDAASTTGAPGGASSAGTSGAGASGAGVSGSGGQAGGSQAGAAGGGQAGSSGAGQAGVAGTGGGAQIGVEEVTAAAAASICDALFRCCSPGNVEAYFAQYAGNTNLEAYAPKLPPKAQVTKEACPSLVREMLDIIPLGRWVEQAKMGRVAYDGAALATCKETLDKASCGAEVSNALYDGTCLGFNAPLGGDDQRKMFKRTARSGDPCFPLNDGNGALFYGTCDPKESFCCYAGATSGVCSLPGKDKTGACKAVAAEGAVCSVEPSPGQPIDLELCATGVDCIGGKCKLPATTPLEPGDTCYDTQTFEMLGVCTGSYCDLFKTARCVVSKADGEACDFPDECTSLACENKLCGPSTFCTSNGG